MHAAMTLLLAAGLASEGTAAPPEPPPAPAAPSREEPSEAPRRWSSFLPLMAEEARQRGIDLPLPFGASLVYYHLFVLGPTGRL